MINHILTACGLATSPRMIELDPPDGKRYDWLCSSCGASVYEAQVPERCPECGATMQNAGELHYNAYND